MFKTIRSLVAVAVTSSLVITSVFADAVTDYAKENLVYQLFLKKIELLN
jgi:hypothetical protein